MWKPWFFVCKQQILKAHTSQRIQVVHSAPLSLAFWKVNSSAYYITKFNILASFCSWADWFESFFDGNPLKCFIIDFILLWAMRGSRGGIGGLDPPTPEKSRKWRISQQYWSKSSKTSPSYQTSIQCWAIIGTPAKRHLKGVSPAGWWWPAYSGIWILKKMKTSFRSWTPSDKTFWIRAWWMVQMYITIIVTAIIRPRCYSSCVVGSYSCKIWITFICKKQKHCYMTPIKDLLRFAETSFHWLWQILMFTSHELKITQDR